MPDIAPIRQVFCNRTLNLRDIKAIGYDMDYTLIHYWMRAWEQRAYSYIQERLVADNWPVEDLRFEPELVMRGLIIDIEYGNVVKANRFGYVKRALHGTEPLSDADRREIYRRTLIDLHEDRWLFLNTLFSISEACMYVQLVDLLDAGKLGSSMGYADLYERVRRSLDEAHMEGRLKTEIIENPERFVALDEEMPLTLMDQRAAGKKVILITNSGWSYAAPMLRFAIDRFMPEGQTWRDLFDLAIVGAQKPDFFYVRMPAYQVVNEDGLLRPHRGPLEEGNVYVGGNASLVENSLGIKGEDILYVGDHLFVDVNVSKSVSRWRTALVLRELEEEIEAASSFTDQQEELERMLARKDEMEARFSAMRLEQQRNTKEYGPQTNRTAEELGLEIRLLRKKLVALDEKIQDVIGARQELLNPHWGLLMRTGNDKSHLARQVERFADIYTGRVSNFLYHTPFVNWRSHRGNLPHDAAASAYGGSDDRGMGSDQGDGRARDDEVRIEGGEPTVEE